MRRKIYCFWEYFLGKMLFLLKKMKSLLTLYFSIEISSFWPLSYWNLLFLITFLLKSLLSEYLSIEISTFSLLFYWNLLFLTTSLLKSRLSESSKTKKTLGNFWFLQFTVSSKRGKAKHFLGFLFFFWILVLEKPKLKPKNQKTKTLRRMFWFEVKRCFFWFS